MPNLLFSRRNNKNIIDSVAKLVQKALAADRGVYFRGHADKNWKIVPTIARFKTLFHAGKPIPEHDIAEQEKLLLHRFRRHTYEQRGRILNEWEALFLARHHDLPVRLLDWTHNPLVALYFAALHEKPEQAVDGAIWWFKRIWRKRYIDVFNDTNPFDYHGIQMVFPFYPTTRMTAQSGLFTIHSLDWWDDLGTLTQLDVERKLRAGETADKKATIDIEYGGVWYVPGGNKADILEELERFGINHRTMYPELDGLAKGLMQTERFRERPEYPPV